MTLTIKKLETLGDDDDIFASLSFAVSVSPVLLFFVKETTSIVVYSDWLFHSFFLLILSEHGCKRGDSAS